MCVAKKWKQPKCPSIDDWIKKMYMCTMEYCSAKKKMKFATIWMDLLENIMLSKISQAEKLRTI